VLVFVSNTIHQTMADSVRQNMFNVDLTGSSTVFTSLLADQTDTIWNRLTKLAQGFKDGVLTLAGFKADKVETNELCVGSTCITESELQELINQKNTAAAAASTPDTSGTPSTGGDTGASGTAGGSGDTGTTTPPDVPPTNPTEGGGDTPIEPVIPPAPSDTSVPVDTSAP
jgi:hypothetical protein